ncbi:MAG: hypothetical protein RL077_5973 [Verrucomicrobiota bacterium]
MPPFSRWSFLIIPLLGALVATLGAQVAPANSVSGSSSVRPDEPIVLSPFEVGAESVRGYQSTAVLQGGRGRIELADVAGQVAVFTKEFLEDIAATTTDEAYLFSATTQTYFDNVNGNGDSRPGSRNIADDSGNSRGLGNIDKTRNYFRTTIEADAYNTERFSLVSGANAVQFGLGGSAGTSESTSARANLSRNRQKIQLRTDSYGTERTVFDLSQVLIPKKLAVRAITLRENKEYYIQPGYDDNRRAFATVTYQPFQNTTVRIEGEYVHRRDARPPTTMARDNGYMSWLASQRAGNPQTYLNRAATAATAGRPAAPSFALSDGTLRAYAFSTKPALFVFPQNSVPAFTGLQDVRNTVVVNISDGAGSAGTTQTLMDPGLPWNTSASGWSRYNFRRSRNVTGTIEQRLARNTFLEVGYSYEFYRNQTAQLFANNGFDVLVDINRFLPDGATSNPLYGRPYIESNNSTGQGNWADNTIYQARAVLTHQWDLTRHAGWTRHLGLHRFGFFSSYEDSATYTLAQLRNLIIGKPSFLSVAAQNNPLVPERALHMRYYLPTFGSTRDPREYGIAAPTAYGDIMETMYFPMANGERFAVSAFENPVGDVGTAPSANHLQRGSLAGSTSSLFFKNHFVANVGVRYDRVRNSNFGSFQPILAETPFTAQNPLGTGFRAYDEFRGKEPPSVWTPYRAATRANYGFIMRPPWLSKWVSFGYDYSRNASLNEVAVVRDVTGAVVEPNYGESREYSLRLRLLDDRLNFKLNYFNSLNRNTTLADSGLRQNLINFEQQLFQSNPSYAINPLFKEALNPLPGDFRLPGDRNSSGVEVDLTYNPTPEWRLFWNLGRTKTEIDDISTQPWWDYLEQKLPIWKALKGGWSTAAYSPTQTVEAAYNSLIQAPIDDVQASLGNQGANAQTWRSNFVATRSFSQGWLKGGSTSVNFRYRGPSIVGFPDRVDAKGKTRTVRDQPYMSSGYVLTGLMANYRFRGPGNTSWRAQLNANNVFNAERVFVTRTFANGTPRNYGRQAGREFILSVDVER